MAPRYFESYRKYPLPDFVSLVDKLTKFLREQKEDSLNMVLLLVQEEFAERLVMEYESDVGSLGMTALLDWESNIIKKFHLIILVLILR